MYPKCQNEEFASEYIFSRAEMGHNGAHSAWRLMHKHVSEVGRLTSIAC